MEAGGFTQLLGHAMKPDLRLMVAVANLATFHAGRFVAGAMTPTVFIHAALAACYFKHCDTVPAESSVQVLIPCLYAALALSHLWDGWRGNRPDTLVLGNINKGLSVTIGDLDMDTYMAAAQLGIVAVPVAGFNADAKDVLIDTQLPEGSNSD